MAAGGPTTSSATPDASRSPRSSSSPASPAWTISSSSSSSSSSSPSSPSSPPCTSPSPTRPRGTPAKAAFTSPPLSPMSQRRRQRALTTAHQRGWLTAPRARQVLEASAAAYSAGTLPAVKPLAVEPPAVPPGDLDGLCDGLNKALDFSGEKENVALRGSTRWLEAGDFGKGREASAQRLLEFLDRAVLGGALLRERVGGAPRVAVTWSARLYKTAGRTYMKRRAVTGERTAAIELSAKVVDEPARLYNTLAHEMCHAATWIIDECAKPPHGSVFKSWAGRFSRWDPTLQITTCHDYDIRYKFNYECQCCGQNYGRHSKSINTNNQVCGLCRGALTLVKS